MKVLVINSQLEQKHFVLISSMVAKLGGKVAFYKTESEIPPCDFDADVIYGFAPSIVKTSKNLKWLCVPWAGVDSLMVPGYFAMALIMMRRLNEFLEETGNGLWFSPRAQKSLKDCRITVLGTGDIGTTFAKRVKAFEPTNIIGVCRSGKSNAAVYDKVLPVSELDSVLPETDLLAMSLPATVETKGILSRVRMELMPEGLQIILITDILQELPWMFLKQSLFHRVIGFGIQKIF